MRVLGGVLVTIACGGRAPATAPPPAPAEPEVATVDAGADPGCLGGCRKRYPAEYCDELCAPVTEPSAQCMASCERSHQPGARYDDNGEYVQPDDERDVAQRAADTAACGEECSKIPTLSTEALAACLGACTAAGEGTEESCLTSCDPDPYDQCRYSPCD